MQGEAFKLTAHEHYICNQLIQGRTNQEIAQTLKVSLESVEIVLRHIYDKLKVQNRVEASVYYLLTRYPRSSVYNIISDTPMPEA